jgi:hypothetical protein
VDWTQTAQGVPLCVVCLTPDAALAVVAALIRVDVVGVQGVRVTVHPPLEGESHE